MAREGKARVLNENEFKQLLLIAKDSPFALRNVAMIYCSFGLGLRVKEIASLTFKDVLDYDCTLLEEVNLKHAITKGEKQRHVYLSNSKVAAALAKYIQQVRHQEQDGFNINASLFKTQRGNSFQPDVLQKWFRKLYDKAGITGASSHSGRRTFITRLIEQGTAIKTVSLLAGHTYIATTSKYAKENPAQLKRITNLAIF